MLRISPMDFEGQKRRSRSVNKKGIVYLVGAGPGRADLMTVRAKELLMKADVVAYDALISPTLLATIPPHAKLIPIGYRGYGSSKLGYNIHPLVIEMARAGKNVVRLKSGDPFIFGRGYQECIALKEEGIDFEVVPGVSSSLGAASFAGFPLTHRDFASDVVFASGHDLRGGSPSNSKWKPLAQTGGTIVIYMAASKIEENCKRLIEHGRKPETPAIYIGAATCGNEIIIQGTLSDLSSRTKEINPKVQALIIVGEVIHSREHFDWRKKLPLRNKRIFVARAREQKSELAESLKNLGADVLEAPFISSHYKKNVFLTEELKKNKCIIFSDPKTVDYFFENLFELGLDIRDLMDHQLITLDEKTSMALGKRALQASCLHGHCENALTRVSLPSKVLILGGDRGRKSLMDDLQKIQIESTYLSLYEVQSVFPDIYPPEFDAVVFASSSSVKIVGESSWEKVLSYPVFTIGKKTSEEAKKYNQNVIQASYDSLKSLLECISEKIGEKHED